MGIDTLFAAIPLKINPFTGLALLFGLAFVPHVLKGIEIQKKLKSDGKPYTIANSRLQSNVYVADNSSAGRRISILNGCHINGLEAFQYFSIAVLAAICTNISSSVIEGACGLFFIIRVCYTVVYLSPLNGFLRTVMWLMGVSTAIGLLLRAGEQYKILNGKL